MRKNFSGFAGTKIHNFGQALINIFIFLPYFFSVSALLRTLFNPWRNLVVYKREKGFSFAEWGNRIAFNSISRIIGFIMRLSIVSFYILGQSVFMLFLPFAALAYFMFIPLMYIFYLFEKTEDEKKEIARKNFLTAHSFKEDSHDEVNAWFENYYQSRVLKSQWWRFDRLMDFPPLARDWSVGYTPNLDKYSTDLADFSYLHHIKNIVDRRNEISEIERTLSKNYETNVVIVGEEGVGKHTIVDALAKKIYLGKTNISLLYKRILKLNMEKIMNSYTDHKQRENFFSDLLEEAVAARNIILFIENIENYLSDEPGKIDLSGIIYKYGKSDLLQIIAVTDPYSYEKYFITNEKMNRIFSKITVDEVTNEEAKKILLEAVFDFENYHQIIIPYEAVNEIIEKSEYYITYIPFPEKAVDLLDNVCVYARAKNEEKVSPQMVNIVLSEKTHIPTTVSEEMKSKLINLESLLFSKIINQKEAVKNISSTLRRSFLLIGKRKKPLASFLFLGPTGVGKTETAKAIVEVFFTFDKNLIRFDMSLYQSKKDIPKLIGDTTFSTPGLLSTALRKKPYGLLLLDEVEKADHDLLNIFLTILDEGYFTDGSGRRVDCKNLVIIATSNAGAELTWKNSNPDYEKIVDYLVESGTFLPEFLNRFDGIVVYNSLTPEALLQIGRRKTDKIAKDIFNMYQVNLNVSENKLKKMVEKAYDPKFGARNLDRVIREDLEDAVAKKILEDKVKKGEKLNF